MRTLADLYARTELLGSSEALRHFNGYRTRRQSYAQMRERVAAFGAFLQDRGIGKGDHVLIWCESRPEWVHVFWGCVLSGATLVPVDPRSSAELAARIAGQVGAQLVVYGEQTAPLAGVDSQLSAGEVANLPKAAFAPVDLTPDDVVEVVFTSGSTSEPKGVVHRHRNICSNLTGVAREIDRYRRWARPFQPLRILDLLPLSHLFGQTMGLFMPPLLGGAAAFTEQLSPPAVLETIRRERISVLVAVPQMLAQLQGEAEGSMRRPPQPLELPGAWSIAESWWRHRDLHRRTGWKFWAFVVGGAALDPELESFWRRCGFAVIQGYGLTEASPVVAVNHPFSARRGSIGKALPGQEVKLAPDGEILVRGPSVVTEYFGDQPEGSSTKFRDGWLHTGDLAEADASGRLYFKGRKSDLIVRPDGMNVYPGDVERVLRDHPAVDECVVVGVDGRIHAALVLRASNEPVDDAQVPALVAAANQQLESHQRVQDWSLWKADELPRTASTLKIKRNELIRLISSDGARSPTPTLDLLLDSPGPQALDAGVGKSPDADLGLSSLERVELLGKVEEKLGRQIDEESFAAVHTVGDLEALLESDPAPDGAAAPPPSNRPPNWLLEPRWNRGLVVRGIRAALQQALIFPLSDLLMKVEPSGLENLQPLEPPVLFIANHASHLDTLALLRALPSPWRRRLAPAMSQDFFADLFLRPGAAWQRRASDAAAFLAACGLFNAYPLPQKISGARRALRYTGELVDQGWSPLLYPEGTRTTDGKLLPFQSGVGLIALELGLTVVPVHLAGLFEIYSVHDEQPRKGTARVRFGRPLRLDPSVGYQRGAELIEQAFRELADSDSGT